MELVPLLESCGINLSGVQVHGFVTEAPERIRARTFAALCEILDCVHAAGLLIAFSVGLIGVGTIVGPMATFFAELFDTPVRFSGLSMGWTSCTGMYTGTLRNHRAATGLYLT